MIRNYLFLQGPIGPFFKTLGEELQAHGYNVLKINFNGGDKFFWEDSNSIDFTHDISKWEDYVRDIAKLRKITDLVVYGDCREIHKIAIDTLKTEDVRVHVFEEGYFRPNWITYEMKGVNANSSLPQNPQFYKNLADDNVVPNIRFGASFYPMTWYAINYYLASIPGMYGKFKAYNHHFEVSPHYTMAMWVPRILASLWNKFQAKYQQNEIIKLKYFLVPLQLCRDYQIKAHSQFNSVLDFISYTIDSFAKNADNQDCLVFKIHPLDNEPLKIYKQLKFSAEKNSISDRVRVIDGGHLPTLISHAKGVVVVNSTTGLSSIHHHKPTIALSSAIYNFEGLTNQCKLEEFWKSPQAPDSELYKRFRSYVIGKTQINGSFYVAKGIRIGAKRAANLMIKNSVATNQSTETGA